jgi:hypothetical protein
VKTMNRDLMLATMMFASLAVAVPLVIAPSLSEESATGPTNLDLKPSAGQINHGAEHPAPSSSIEIRKISSIEEARAALIAIGDPNPVAG